jgi:hypothetical protein
MLDTGSHILRDCFKPCEQGYSSFDYDYLDGAVAESKLTLVTLGIFSLKIEASSIAHKLENYQLLGMNEAQTEREGNIIGLQYKLFQIVFLIC